jgi:hypothetical protein
MPHPVAGCDAPACKADLVALIRGVGLCEDHFRLVAECAAEQDVDPAELSRGVIVALLAPAGRPAAERVAKPRPLPALSKPRPGFYWVRDDGDWTVVQVSPNGEFRRVGREGASSLAEQDFGRMVPINKPLGFPWEPTSGPRA